MSVLWQRYPFNYLSHLGACHSGTLPINGPYGLAQAFKSDLPLAKLLTIQLHSDFVSALARGFSIFAIVTSFGRRTRIV